VATFLFYLSEDGAGFLPSNPSSRVRPSTAFRPATCPNTWRAEPRKKNTLSFFKKKFHPRQIRNARSVFSFGVSAESARRCGGAILRAYDLGQSHHALRACLIRGSAGNESELFGIMTINKNLPRLGEILFFLPIIMIEKEDSHYDVYDHHRADIAAEKKGNMIP
jgi:hypothetical protein